MLLCQSQFRPSKRKCSENNFPRNLKNTNFKNRTQRVTKGSFCRLKVTFKFLPS